MSKYGWTKGSGLGADEGGIVNPLRVQVEKRKKKSDAEGGGWADPANRAKILGGRRKDAEGEGGGKFGGPMSEVIVLQHMLDDMEDLQGEIANGLGQEIGEECGEKVREEQHPHALLQVSWQVCVDLLTPTRSTAVWSDCTSTSRTGRSSFDSPIKYLRFV